jgi:hypothetical protein
MQHLSRLMLAVIAGLVAGAIASCNQLPADCRMGGADTKQFSTRALFLERLNGCPIGGGH